MSNGLWFVILALSSIAWAVLCHGSIKRVTLGFITVFVIGSFALFLASSENIKLMASIYLIMTALYYLFFLIFREEKKEKSG